MVQRFNSESNEESGKKSGFRTDTLWKIPHQ